MAEFWYDTYLMWEMLVFEEGYSDENVYILFADGIDFTFEGMDDRYSAYTSGYDHITDYYASKANLENVFEGLATGSNGFPQLTEDDFLFVWTFGHGYTMDASGDFSFLYLMNPDFIFSSEFAALTDQISAGKKVFWMQQCLSGDFSGDLAAPNTVFHSAVGHQIAYSADNYTINGEEVDEYDKFWTTESPYAKHGEFNFHLYSCTVGESPDHIDHYNGEPYTNADENTDNCISLLECFNWEFTHQSWITNNPVYSDIGNIGANTSLEYPTLLFDNMITNETHRGIIGLSKSFSVQTGTELVFMDKSKIDILNGSAITVKSGATLTIGNDAQITNGKIIIENGAMFNIGSDVNLDNVEIELYNSALNASGITLDNQSKIWLFGLGTYEILYSKFYNGSQVLGVNNQGSVLIQNCKLYDSFIHIDINMISLNCGVSIINNLFSNSDTHTAIRIDGCDVYDINNNTIDSYEEGIEIWNSGFGKGNYNVRYNTVTNTDGSAILFMAHLGL